MLIDVKDNSPRLSPVKPFQATRKAVVQRITKKLFEKIIHLLVAEVSTSISIAQSQGKKKLLLEWNSQWFEARSNFIDSSIQS